MSQNTDDGFDPVTYAQVNAVWEGIKFPPITVTESHALATKLLRKFGGRKMRTPWFMRRPNRSWARTTSSFDRHHVPQGLAKMVHDIGHYVHSELHPLAKNHCAPHAALEKAMAEHVIAKGWHLPKVKPQPKPKPSAAEARAQKLARTQAAIRRWETKAKRANTALRKLRASERGLRRHLPAPAGMPSN